MGKEFDELEKERIPRQFPKDSQNIYHIHPIAFVEHMKLITAPLTPLWIEVAIEEAKGIHEDLKPTINMVKKYHNYCGIFDNPKTLKTVENEATR